jgi:hypothetical protein
MREMAQISVYNVVFEDPFWVCWRIVLRVFICFHVDQFDTDTMAVNEDVAFATKTCSK